MRLYPDRDDQCRREQFMKPGIRRAILCCVLAVAAGHLGAPCAPAQKAELFPLKWKVDTALENNGVVAGVVDGQRRVFVTGLTPYHGPPPRTGFLVALDGAGRLLFKISTGSAGISVFPSFLEVRGLGPCVFYACESKSESAAEARLVNARDGQVIWRQPTSNQFSGNGSCVLADVDGDGEQEIVYGDQAAVRCFRARDGRLEWVVNDRILICHGRLAFGDTNGDGTPELVLGTEYANPDSTSSMLALDGRGRTVWRQDRIAGDLGSTPAVICDVDGDGRPEVLKVELDLEHRGKMTRAGLYCFEGDGRLRYRADFGCSGMAVGDLDGDGVPEAVGVSDRRDGGEPGRDEIRCLDLKAGRIKWSTPIERVWLGCQDPVMADLTGDGTLSVLLTANNPSGYGHKTDQPPYGDAYVVDRHGKILWKKSLPDFVHQPFVCDVDGDGRTEIVLACHDGSISCLATQGKAGQTWSVTGGNFRRTYSSTPLNR
jgi:outer membrane protein assembly factor BamB